jgi:hypothetical protein
MHNTGVGDALAPSLSQDHVCSMRSPSSRYRQSAFASFICLGDRHFTGLSEDGSTDPEVYHSTQDREQLLSKDASEIDAALT